VVMVDACAVCTHSRSEHLRGRLACSYVIDEHTACKCAEYVELRPTRDGTVECEHGCTVSACPRCQTEAPKDGFTTFQAVLILACTAAIILAALPRGLHRDGAMRWCDREEQRSTDRD